MGAVSLTPVLRTLSGQAGLIAGGERFTALYPLKARRWRKHGMAIAVLSMTPALAALFMPRKLPAVLQTWLPGGVVSVLFFWLLSYLPAVQAHPDERPRAELRIVLQDAR